MEVAMKRKYQDLIVDFPLELQYIKDVGLESGYSEHPMFWFKAVVPEEKADEYIGKITEDTSVKVTYMNRKKKETRVLFAGYAVKTRLTSEDGFFVLYVKALAHTAKLDVEKKSRSFFKKKITYHEIIQAIGKDYPNCEIIENIPSNRKTDMPILQYKETDWEFLKRIASMFEAVVTPDCTKNYPYITLGVPKRLGKAKNVKIEEQITIRDIKECYEDFYEEMTAFSVLKIMKKEKEEKKKEKEKKKAKNVLKQGELADFNQPKDNKKAAIGTVQDTFLLREELKERKEMAENTKNSIQAMIDSGELDISSLGYSNKEMDELIFNALTSLTTKDNNNTKEKIPDVSTEKGKQAAESQMEELNHTMLAVRATKYVPLGKRMKVDGSELTVTHVEMYVKAEQIYYEYILRWADSITARYHDNPALAGISLIGTIKERIGNTVSLNLEIDKDDGYDNGGEDYFFTYALESKDYYCMPVKGAKVHLYFQTGKEWEAIAIHSLRGIEAGGEREYKISNPDNRSFSNPTGCSIDLTPSGISMTPDDGNTVEMKLEKNGDISLEAKNITLTGKDIQLGRGTTAEGEEILCKNFSMKAGEKFLINRCQEDAEGAIVPIEDHLIGMAKVVQLYTPLKIYHNTTGLGKAPAVSYDETELRDREEKEAEKHNDQIRDVLIAREQDAKSRFGTGLIMAVVGAALIAGTGGLAVGLVGAGMCAFATMEMSDGLQIKKLANEGDWETDPVNIMKEVMGEELYTIVKNGFCIAGSIILGGGGVLLMGGMSTAVSLAFDLSDGHLDASWMDVVLCQVLVQIKSGKFFNSVS